MYTGVIAIIPLHCEVIDQEQHYSVDDSRSGSNKAWFAMQKTVTALQ